MNTQIISLSMNLNLKEPGKKKGWKVNSVVSSVTHHVRTQLEPGEHNLSFRCVDWAHPPSLLYVDHDRVRSHLPCPPSTPTPASVCPSVNAGINNINRLPRVSLAFGHEVTSARASVP